MRSCSEASIPKRAIHRYISTAAILSLLGASTTVAELGGIACTGSLGRPRYAAWKGHGEHDSSLVFRPITMQSQGYCNHFRQESACNMAGQAYRRGPHTANLLLCFSRILEFALTHCPGCLAIQAYGKVTQERSRPWCRWNQRQAASTRLLIVSAPDNASVEWNIKLRCWAKVEEEQREGQR